MSPGKGTVAYLGKADDDRLLEHEPLHMQKQVNI
jgi:hypothetical protein